MIPKQQFSFLSQTEHKGKDDNHKGKLWKAVTEMYSWSMKS